MNNKVRKSFWCSAINHFPSLLTDLGRTCSFICIRPKWSACVERIDTSWHLDSAVSAIALGTAKSLLERL